MALIQRELQGPPLTSDVAGSEGQVRGWDDAMDCPEPRTEHRAEQRLGLGPPRAPARREGYRLQLYCVLLGMSES